MTTDRRNGLTLYYADVLAPRKACAAAKHLKAPVEFVYLDLHNSEHKAPSYLALNPNGTVPTLTDGDQVVWEADAIMCHLAARVDSDFWPRDRRQIDVVRWLSWSAQHFTRAGGELYFESIIKARFGLGGPDETAVARALAAFRRYAAILNDHLQSGLWLVGDALTVADFSVAAVLPFAEKALIPINEFAHIRRWHDRLNEIEAWRQPFPPIAGSPFPAPEVRKAL
jgi:glutathione S-transferase